MLTNMQKEKIFEERAFRLIHKGLDNPENLKEFEQVSDAVCECKNAFIAYAYAERISPFCYGNERLMKAMHLKNLQEIVINSDDEEYMYYFGTRVCGAELKSLIAAMPYGGLRNKLEREAIPIDELDF